MTYIKLIAVFVALLLTTAAQAHKFSTAFMDVMMQDSQPHMQFKVTLHDLAQAQLIAAAGSQQISWQQVLDSETLIQRYLAERLTFSSAGQACAITLAPTADWLMQRIAHDMYLLLPLSVNCDKAGQWQLGYTALFDAQHNHKLLLNWQLAPEKVDAVISASQPFYPADKAP